LALRNGEVWVWGYRGSGQQGNGSNVVGSSAAPARVTSLSNIVQVTGSAYTLVAIDNQGKAWGWGQNLYGAAGVGQATGNVNTPRQISFSCNDKIVQVEAGEYCFIARCEAGHVYTWGHNLYGQIGNGGSGNHPQPYRVNLPSSQTARLVGASYEGAFVVTTQGNIYAWGRNPGQSLALPARTNELDPYRNPTLVSSQLNAYAGNITFIAGGYRHGHAILDDGRVIGWGTNNRLGRSGTGTTATPVTVIGAGGTSLQSGEKVIQLHSRFIGSIALTDKNRVFTWGSGAFDIYGSTVRERLPPSGRTIVEIGGGKEHVYYRTSDRYVWGVGYGALNKLSLTGVSNRSWPGVIVNLPQ
jgi:alpha-tubulin suppressor-like RCC1 family protein